MPCVAMGGLGWQDVYLMGRAAWGDRVQASRARRADCRSPGREFYNLRAYIQTPYFCVTNGRDPEPSPNCIAINNHAPKTKASTEYKTEESHIYNNRRLVEGTPCLRINLSNYNERNKLQHPNATATGRTKDGRLTLSCRPQRQGDGVRGERALPHSNTTLETTQGGEIEAIAACRRGSGCSKRLLPP